MTSNWTGHERPTQEPPRRPPAASRRLSLGRLDRNGALILAALAVLIMASGIALASGGAPAGSPGSTDQGGGQPSATPFGTSASPSGGPPASTSAPPIGTTTPPLPSLLAAIGDSYSQAYAVSKQYKYDNPRYSWVVGTDKNDGVLSLLERFRALGGSPTVVTAATSGRKMSDASRQAGLVVAAARKLAPGKTAYVTFELGTNDLCASPDPVTDPALFGSQLTDAMATLRAGLPAGSRILMLPVPDFAHFRDITQADPAAKAYLSLARNADRCAPYLGTSSPSALTAAEEVRSQYDAGLEGACADINAHEGATGRLHCTYDTGLLSDSDFTVGDMSAWDRFHPSLSGQAKMARDAWSADVWASMGPRP